MTKTKICGITRLEDIQSINALGESAPDYIGFVFAKSPRRVTAEQAQALKTALNPAIKTVGVFVDEPQENIISLVKNGVIDTIQLHGNETEEYIKTLKQQTNTPIIKAIAIQNQGDAQNRQNTAADYLLLDSKGGGTGKTFDWNLIGKLNKPFFLAGGLNPDNIADAIKTTNPYAVDVSGGVEISKGIKCPQKIAEFVNNVKEGI